MVGIPEEQLFADAMEKMLKYRLGCYCPTCGRKLMG